ncbi:MAG: DUF1553 domain-containing protein [Fuerstiella sp.]|nr:DUF1553 domain-containing protein [Fuerstiella sp.]
MFKAHGTGENHLLQMLRHHDDVSAMPPKKKLPAEIIAAFEQWIRLGAPDSREGHGPTAKEQRLVKAKQHWAFQPPQVRALPVVTDKTWPLDETIDTFVLAAIEAEGIKPVGDANRQTLIRRLYFDLVGLPPSPQDVDEFVADPAADAVERLVDRLLTSPQFGERWGRHWLDVVRFAESSGMEFNFTYPHAWPFRNYVIDSFNADKPFDEFLQEQIAGDLLPTDGKESPAVAEARQIATSVLAFGPKRHNSSGTEFQMDIADDQINVVFKSTLAMTVSCARCHDHKFDPIPTADYYGLAGVFLSTEPLYGTIKQKYSNTPTDLLPIGENAQAKHDAIRKYDIELAAAEKALSARQDELKKATDAEKIAAKEKVIAEKLVAAVTARQDATQTNSADATGKDARSELDTAVAKLKTSRTALATLQAELGKVESKVAKLRKDTPPLPQYAMSVRDRAKPADTKLAVRGDFRNRGDVIPRGFLSAVNVPDAATIDPASSGRLQLANWIASPKNPLTARVMVNRIWHHLFGRGIVPTVDNFGIIGKPPTHPELLDMLALRFVDNGWSVKRMVRAIVLSRAYQLSSHASEQNMTIDPDNRLLWRTMPRRLEAETIRDAVLTVSGQLDLLRPAGSTVTGLGDQLVRSIAPEKIQPPSNHRSVYLPVVRDYVPELFDLFDFPSPSLVSGHRAVTNVPSQSLYLRNSAFVADQSNLAAERLLASKEATDDAQRAALAMRWTLGRIPSAAERDAALQLVNEVRQEEVAKAANSKEKVKAVPDRAAWSAWFLTLFTTAEFRYLADIDT